MNIEGLGWNQATKAIRVHGENLVPLAAKKQNDVFTQLSKVVTNRALVLRDGKKSWVDKSAVVPDDILFLKAGDIVCADSFVLEQDSLLVDESILVEGNAKEVTKKENLNLQRNSQDGIVYSGSYVVGGSAIVKVFATGKNIKYPRAAASNSISKYTGGIFSKVLKNTALKLSKHKVIIKNANAIKELSTINILITDIPGTFTLNKLNVESYDSVIDIQEFLKYSYLSVVESTDPLDKCILHYLKLLNVEEQSEFLLHETPFDPINKFSSRKFKDFEIIKGDPEYIFGLTRKDTAEIQNKIIQNSKNGLKAVAFAIKHNRGFKYIGTYFYYDQIQEGVAAAVKEASRLGIQLKIVTEESKEIASHIARSIGLAADGNIFADTDNSDKYKIIEMLKKEGTVGYISRGYDQLQNLNIANVNLVTDSAVDIAKEKSSIILLSANLATVVYAIEESKKAIRRIKVYKALLLGGTVLILMLCLILSFAF